MRGSTIGAVAITVAMARATAVGNVFGRATGDSCSAALGTGSCQVSTDCKGISYADDLCPNDPSYVQCCVELQCTADGASGYCRSASTNACPEGTFVAGTSAPYPCPGDSDIQCCVPSGAPPSTETLGAQVLAQAQTAAGLPYAWGGGNCAGPTHDEPPYQYGDIGYDCSGLVCWALCTVTGRDLFTEGLRNTNDMYCADEAQLGYQKYPFEERQPGDAVFFGDACNCGDGSIHHVGLMIDSGDRLWNSLDDAVNSVGEESISSIGQPCPSVIRFAPLS